MASNAYHRPNNVQRKDKTSASNVIVEESSNLRTIHLFHPWMIVYFKLVNIVLFLESQYIAKPIQHLKSYKSSDVVKQKPKEYPFKTPLYALEAGPRPPLAKNIEATLPDSTNTFKTSSPSTSTTSNTPSFSEIVSTNNGV
ncbi:unnamed protein product [Rhizophagus irregularis]|uniref:Uncharacterized protein n=1 Tax=Rhizophagus irregularis TaxID=588596 RepID=A0A2I1FC43_9GLOM|nr:hypothetical protein RhiirB3_531821 [Rhizophagus irregularis]CAB5359056.1 unnamed protein product [Rhizophagus irregularis]